MAAQWMVAQDTFAGDLPNGTGFTVLKGQHLLSTHDVVKLVGADSVLFKPAEVPPAEEPAKPAHLPRRAAGKAAS